MPPQFWTVFPMLLLLLGASGGMFVALVWRWTSDRSWREIVEWAHGNGYHARGPRALRGLSPDDEPADAPPPLDALTAQVIRVRALVADRESRHQFIVFETGQPGAAVSPERWNVLIRPLEVDWPPTGLRPAAAARSALDLFSLTSFPLMGETQRFVVYGTDSAPARRLSKSAARGLLSPDVGILLHGRHLLLDFSSRPFDPIEFGRMIALADQLAAHLPVWAQGAQEE